MRVQQIKFESIEKQLQEAHAGHADKVEKGLLKNLLIGYVVAPNPGDKQQVLKLISSVLDFDATESERCGLNRGQNLGWIGAIRNAAAVVGGSTSPAAGKLDFHLIKAVFINSWEPKFQIRTTAKASHRHLFAS